MNRHCEGSRPPRHRRDVCHPLLAGSLILFVALVHASFVDAGVSGKKFRKAAVAGDVVKIAKLLKKNPSEDVIRSGLYTAVFLGQAEVVDLLLDHVEPTASDMETAITRGHDSIVRIFLAAGFDPSLQNPTTGILGRAVTGGYEYEKYADPRGWTPLTVAVRSQNHQIVATLLRAGAAPDTLVLIDPGTPKSNFNYRNMAVGGKGKVLGAGNHGVTGPNLATALILATQNADYESVQQLVLAGADLSIRDSNGNTACDLLDSTRRTTLGELVCGEID